MCVCMYVYYIYINIHTYMYIYIYREREFWGQIMCYVLFLFKEHRLRGGLKNDYSIWCRPLGSLESIAFYLNLILWNTHEFYCRGHFHVIFRGSMNSGNILTSTFPHIINNMLSMYGCVR